MPVEIRELIIRAVVTENQEDTEGAPAGQLDAQDQDSIVAACVKQVLQILRKSKDR